MDLVFVEAALRSPPPEPAREQDAQASHRGQIHLQTTQAADLRPIPSLTLETLPQDVFRLIALETVQKKGSLKRLSGTSRRMRAACMPILFARCIAYPDGEMGVPAEAIRPFVSHLTYLNHFPRFQSDQDDDDDDLRGRSLDTYKYLGPLIPSLESDAVDPVPPDQSANDQPQPASPDLRKRPPSTEPIPTSSTSKKPRLDLAPKPGVELDYLPALRSLSFRCTLKLSHLELMKKSLANPSLLSITFTRSVRWAGGHPDPRVDSPYPPNISITHLKHAPSVWREIITDMERRNMPAEVALESQCLALITLGISNTAEVLELPMESAPIARMSELSWPRLRELSLTGRYYLPSQSTTLPRLLSQMPELRKFAIQIAQPHALRLSRAPIFGRAPPVPIDLPALRTLILAYPDPDDAIFSISATNITYLSLRDWPRYYFHEDVFGYGPLGRWASQLLTSSECLRILRRVSLHYLEKLELAYKVDHADEALLHYIASTFPRLAHLELHRYRCGAEHEVNYRHITEVLTSLAHLRILRLNLDFPDSTGPRTSCAPRHGLDGNGNAMRHVAWLAAAQTRGLEIADVLEPHCAALEYVGILVHDASGSYWWRFRPARCVGGERERVEHERTDAEDDFEPMPLAWGKRGD